MKPRSLKVSLPKIVSREQWLKARTSFLKKEKAFTKARDRHYADLRRLPMVEITEPYVFTGPHGKVTLLDLFDGQDQLIIYHFMWLWKNGKPLKNGCPSCSAAMDHIARGHLQQLHRRDTNFVCISRAPMEKIAAFKRRMGWKFPWVSSADSRFNFDFHVSFDETITPFIYNYRAKAAWMKTPARAFIDQEQPFDLHGQSCFLRVGKKVYHTYSTYGRGTETVGGANYYVDQTALGRQEPWEKPAGRILHPGFGAGSTRMRYPDEVKS
ncbi:DUF899 domain-containing protein [Oleiharenicola lentus]|uniref:DUF899 domain-containing protein n=1 Tax=Oleiharenicola lentus TaxID=2508720 RepID=UPI003F661678